VWGVSFKTVCKITTFFLSTKSFLKNLSFFFEDLDRIDLNLRKRLVHQLFLKNGPCYYQLGVQRYNLFYNSKHFLKKIFKDSFKSFSVSLLFLKDFYPLPISIVILQPKPGYPLYTINTKAHLKHSAK